ncbi:App1 family protein [Pedobacter sp. SYP-B3415]|uniref:App1 family protein n=1 Tax=Pedobacter sp. SYP-B3415 TaxID=2496641 RepID=UPI00101E01DC|nr:phosphatase domain-containing protein [Pedobacter sp. SYP-B3415]
MSVSQPSVKVYHGYGHTHNLVVYGHVFRKHSNPRQVFSNSLFVNVRHLLRLFLVKTWPFVKVRLRFRDQEIYNRTEYDGFFKFEFSSDTEVNAGWHEVFVEVLDDNDQALAGAKGTIYVPHVTQYAFISDIDDTVMVSHSATIARRLRELFIKNPRTRKTFPRTAEHYKLLSGAYASSEKPNPFFYVSSSEWNLYDYLVETFRFNKLPEGAFLLNQIKRWKDLVKTGKTGHEGKLVRVLRIFDAFPKQKFIFFGDNSQRDPYIYTAIAEKYPDRVAAVYIRNIRPEVAAETRELLGKLTSLDIPHCLFASSEEAMDHSHRIGLIENWRLS